MKEIEWIQHFKTINGREPTLEEIKEATNKGHIIQTTKSTVNQTSHWIVKITCFVSVLLSLGFLFHTVYVIHLETSQQTLKSSFDESSNDDNGFDIDSSNKSETEINSDSKSSDKTNEKTKKSDSVTQTSRGEVYEENKLPKRWNDNKNQELANFMITWGNSMGQPNYKNITGHNQGELYENNNSLTKMDTAYDERGISSAQYTIVATYEYEISVNKRHRYHFAIDKEGRPYVFYSQNAQSLNKSNKGFDYLILKQTENKDLSNGFSQIVYSK